MPVNHNPRLPVPPQRRYGIWIDTLCIPVEPKHIKFRKKAISILAQTFAAATTTLVIDRQLLELSARTTPLLEIDIRILCSAWSQRLWTFQEAAVARHKPNGIYFLLGDGALPYSRFEVEKSEGLPSSRYSLSKPELDAVLFRQNTKQALELSIPPIHHLQGARYEKSSKFEKLYKAVVRRTTSKMADEPLILSIILELDISRILKHDTRSARMQQFYIMMGEIPAMVIFDYEPGTDVEKTIECFRWAPISLMAGSYFSKSNRTKEIQYAYTDPEYMFKSVSMGHCTKDGLEVTYSGFVFNTENKLGKIRQNTDVISIEIRGTLRYFTVDSDLFLDPRHGKFKAALIFDDEYSDSPQVQVLRDPKEYSITAASFSIIQELLREQNRRKTFMYRGVLNGSVELRSTTWPPPQSENISWNMGDEPAIFEGKYLPGRQRWCVI